MRSSKFRPPSEAELDDSDDLLMAINSEEIPGAMRSMPTHMAIQIPRMLLFRSKNISDIMKTEDGSLRFGSFIYSNVTGIFPASMPGRNE